ncbi:MAG: type 1 glutamine amidotransferase domain-containing protein [Alphaproteobacteria bacterium]|nr:type 1 glutamine amidotransferase domain-containing protein [Alphaproteobacteria bacterium]
MSGNLNVTNPARKKKILLIAANPAVSPTTGWPVGFWWSELTHPWWAFTEAGYDVEIRSPAGGALVADGFSDPEDASGYSAADVLSLGFKRSPAHAALLADTVGIQGVRVEDYDAVFLSGGQSPMVTFIDDAPLHQLVVDFFEAGKITALVCHATCVLLRARLRSGALLVKGRTWTGFADAEEDYADAYVGQRIQPFRIETEARALEDTNFVVDQMFRPFAVRDGHLITGQQQFSGAEAARLVIEALGR